MTATVLSNTLTEACALIVSASVSSSYGTGSVPVYWGRNFAVEPQLPMVVPNVVIYTDNVTFPENYNLAFISGSLINTQTIGKCNLNIEVTQYATDTPESDILGELVFGTMEIPKQSLEQVTSGSLFIYSAGQAEVFDTINNEDMTWVQKLTIPILATIAG